MCIDSKETQKTWFNYLFLQQGEHQVFTYSNGIGKEMTACSIQARKIKLAKKTLEAFGEEQKCFHEKLLTIEKNTSKSYQKLKTDVQNLKERYDPVRSTSHPVSRLTSLSSTDNAPGSNAMKNLQSDHLQKLNEILSDIESLKRTQTNLQQEFQIVKEIPSCLERFEKTKKALKTDLELLKKSSIEESEKAIGNMREDLQKLKDIPEEIEDIQRTQKALQEGLQNIFQILKDNLSQNN